MVRNNLTCIHRDQHPLVPYYDQHLDITARCYVKIPQVFVLNVPKYSTTIPLGSVQFTNMKYLHNRFNYNVCANLP